MPNDDESSPDEILNEIQLKGTIWAAREIFHLRRALREPERAGVREVTLQMEKVAAPERILELGVRDQFDMSELSKQRAEYDRLAREASLRRLGAGRPSPMAPRTVASTAAFNKTLRESLNERKGKVKKASDGG